MKFPFIQAWGEMLLLEQHLIDERIEHAEREDASLNAIFYDYHNTPEESSWVTYLDIRGERAKKILDDLLQAYVDQQLEGEETVGNTTWCDHCGTVATKMESVQVYRIWTGGQKGLYRGDCCPGCYDTFKDMIKGFFSPHKKKPMEMHQPDDQVELAV